MSTPFFVASMVITALTFVTEGTRRVYEKTFSSPFVVTWAVRVTVSSPSPLVTVPSGAIILSLLLAQ